MRTDIWMAVPTALLVQRGTGTLMFRLGLRVSEATTAARVTDALKRVLSNDVHVDPSDVPYARFKGLERTMPVLDHLLLVAGLSALAGTVGVLLAVCANLAILLLTSALERRPEMALRRALGARRRDIVTDVVAEPVLMAAVGGIGGVFLARAALAALGTFQPGQGPGLQYDFVAAIDWRVIAFSLGATSMACLGCALVAVRSLSGLSIETLLGTAEVTTARRRGLLPSLLMTVHVAVTVALMSVAVFAVRNRIDQSDRQVGFDRSQLVFAMVRNDSPSVDMAKAIDEMERRLAIMPGVIDISHSASLPFAGDPMGGRVGIGSAVKSASIVQVGRGYFETLGIPRLRGRGFVADDFLPLPTVALLSATTARQWFGDRDPLGQVMEISATRVTVVGVTGDADHGTGLGRAKPTVYLPLSLCPASVYVLVRGRPALTVPALQRVVASPPQGIGVASLDSVRNLMDNGAWYPVRTSAAIALLLGVIAAATCTMGQYAVVARAAARRRREMAVRCVLGARGQEVLWQLLSGQVVPLVVGAALGTWAIIVSRRLLATVLSGGLQVGWGAMVASCLLVLVVSAFACVAAAFRATRVPPASLLRQR
jgi:ABC-type antimicrobial peptide transport system permease subunit